MSNDDDTMERIGNVANEILKKLEEPELDFENGHDHGFPIDDDDIEYEKIKETIH